MTPVVLKLGATNQFVKEGRTCLLTTLQLTCKKRGFAWSPKDPSPLVERAAEIGGCEFLRILACPVSLGFLKPATSVICASGRRLMLAKDTYTSMAEVREKIA